MATTKITSPDLFDIGSLDSALRLPSGTEAQRPASPSTGEWRYNTDSNTIEFWDGIKWRTLSDQIIPPTPSENFNTVLYNGTGSAQSITGVGFKPDLVWIKQRNGTAWHSWFDSTRGVGNRISSNSINAQNFDIQRLSSFDADGFSLGSDGDVNGSGKTFVAWCWKANGGTTSSNTEGTITSTVQANTKAAFSVVKFVGTGANATVGHGLGATPEIIIFKSSTAISGWKMFTNQTSDPANQVMELSDPNGVAARTDAFNGTLPTSTLFSLGTYSDVNNNGNDMIAYCFASVAGYSSIGSYTGNGSANGPIVNTGFEPAFLIVKRTDSSANWRLVDNKRSPSNPRQKVLFPNLSNAESDVSDDAVDFLTNGFQIKNNDSSWNNNGGTYLYIAFGSDASAAPALADSFDVLPYTGTGNNQTISGYNFNIANGSLLWVKSRNASNNWNQYDTIRGPENRLVSNLSQAQDSSGGLDGFTSDGFTLRGGYDISQAFDYITYAWKTNIPAINTDGTIQSVVSANQAAACSVVKYTGNGVNGSTVGHGLGVAPEVMIIKSLSSNLFWAIYHKYNTGSSGNPATERLKLPTNLASATTTVYWDSTEPGTSVFTIGTDTDVNTNNDEFIAYCFTSISGFSNMGSYAGNGGSKAITGLGFQPSWVLIKSIGSENWMVYDNVRTVSVGDNPGTANARPYLILNSAGKENGVTSYNVNLDSDGFSMDTSAGDLNTNGQTYIYMGL